MLTSLLTIFTVVLIVVYYKYYGPQNFLWFSDVGLFLTVIALWLRSSLIMSVAILVALPFEVLWVIDFFAQMLNGRTIVGLATYMFDGYTYPLHLRLLSIFHIFLPIIWVWALISWKYNPHAFVWAVGVCWFLLGATYWFTDPKKNINWVFLPEQHNWQNLTTQTWFGILVVGLPLVVYLPMHLIFLFFQK